MRYRARITILVLPVVLLVASLSAQESARWRDPSPHKVQFITVDKDVRLEVLDWGGSGRPVVLLAGLGNTAHVFDDFAPKLTAGYHVYGITRRGFGASSVPGSGYGADRLGDDVLAVIDALNLNKPVLVGHSIAGEELSSVGSRYPGRVGGLIYLDAGYQYAFDNGKGSAMEELQSGAPPDSPPGPGDLASFAALQAWFQRTAGCVLPEAVLREGTDPTPDGRPLKLRGRASVRKAIQAGRRKYTNIPVRVLAIFAEPHNWGPELERSADPAAEAYITRGNALVKKQTKAFEAGLPGARVVRLRHANHYVFISNEADVLAEMNAFLSALK